MKPLTLSMNSPVLRVASARRVATVWISMCAAVLIVACVDGSPSAKADSALDLISGFDNKRLETTYPIEDTGNVRELSKLLYRIGKLKRPMLERRLDADLPADLRASETGDAIRVSGVVTKMQAYAVPGELPELLDFEKIAKITIAWSGTQEAASSRQAADTNSVVILTAALQQQLAIGDRVAAVGVRLPGDAEIACAAGQISWFPKEPDSVGWQLLSDQGFDLSQLATLRKLSRRSFTAEDATPFYSMIQSADAVSRISPPKTPELVSPAELLGDPTSRIGDWMSIDAETVRVTRISVTEPKRRDQIGADHYYQIDSIGKLGNVQVQVSRFEGDPNPIEFQNRYPLSVVMKTLPDFLNDRISADTDSVVALVNHPVQVEGFYYRLWSYKSDLMEREGAGDQFGPLVIATAIRNKRIDTASDPVGVSAIGYFAAGFLLISIVAITAWSVRTSKQDKQARASRPEPGELNLDQ